MHILVVEDEQRLAYLLRRVLLEERHSVDVAHDGHTGLDLALSDTYDVVVLDIMLPGIDGIEVCRQMRAERRRFRLPGQPGRRMSCVRSTRSPRIIRKS